MLQRIRDGLQGQRWLAYLVLGALALVFAAWGVYGLVDFNLGTGAAYAAKAEGEKIAIDDVRNAWMRQQTQWQQSLGGDIPPELRKTLQDQLLESFIRNALLNLRTDELGYRVSDDQLKDAIRNEPAFQVDGRYSAQVARERLQQVGLSLTEFETEMRRSLQQSQLQRGIALSDFVTPRELERLNALENEQREVRYALLPVEKYAASIRVDDAMVKEYYDRNAARFRTPESVHLAFAELRYDDIAAQVPVADADVRAEYEKAKDRYVQPERRRARHILIEAPEGGNAPEAQKKAEELLARAKAGEDFAALAREHSQDTGSAAQGGDLGWAERSYFVQPFADAVFGMSVGEIRGPVRTQFGYHVIRLEEIQAGQTRSFEDVRDEIAAELRRNAAADRFGEIYEEIERRVSQSGSADWDTLVKEFGLQTGEVPQFLRGSGGAPLGSAPELQQVVFSAPVLEERRVGGPVVLGEDRLLLVRVLEHRKPEPRPIAEVRDEIVAAIRNERGAQMALEAAKSAQAKLESGAPFDQVARDLGVKAEPATFIGRSDPSVPAPIRERVFQSRKPTDRPVHLALELDDGAAVVAVTQIRTEPSGSNPQLAEIREREAARRGSGDVAAYIEELRRTADVEKNPRAFEP